MLTLIALLLAGSQAMATDSNDKRLIRGYDGGMMLHAGYLCGIGGKELPPHRAKSLYRIYLLSLRGKHKEKIHKEQSSGLAYQEAESAGLFIPIYY